MIYKREREREIEPDRQTDKQIDKLNDLDLDRKRQTKAKAGIEK